MDFVRAQVTSIRDAIFGKPADLQGLQEGGESLTRNSASSTLRSRGSNDTKTRRVATSAGNEATAESFIVDLRDAVEGDALRRMAERQVKDLEQRLYQIRMGLQSVSITLDVTRPRMVDGAARYTTDLQRRYNIRIGAEAASNPESVHHKLQIAKSDLQKADTRVARSMSSVYEHAQKWADETIPACKIGLLQANTKFFYDLIRCRERTKRVQNGEIELREANRRWTVAMQKSNEANRVVRQKSSENQAELESRARSANANVKVAEQEYNKCREDLQLLRNAQKDSQATFLADIATQVLIDSGLLAPPSPASSMEGDIVVTQEPRYIITDDDRPPIHPLLEKVERTRKALAKRKQNLEKRLDFYSESMSDFIFMKSSGGQEAWEEDYKRRFKHDITAFKTKYEEVIAKERKAYEKARKEALDAGILESELPLTPASFAGEVDGKTFQLVSRSSSDASLKARATWDEQRDRRRIRKWGRKVARGRVEKSWSESPSKLPVTSPVESIGSRGPPSPWENPNVRWIRRENETRRRLRMEAGKLWERKRREVARENLRNRGRQQEPVNRDPWTDEMEDVQFGMAEEDEVYDGPDGEPDGGESWKKATETTNTLRLPLYPSAADRRRRRR